MRHLRPLVFFVFAATSTTAAGDTLHDYQPVEPETLERILQEKIIADKVTLTDMKPINGNGFQLNLTVSRGSLHYLLRGCSLDYTPSSQEVVFKFYGCGRRFILDDGTEQDVEIKPFRIYRDELTLVPIEKVIFETRD